MGAQPMSSTLLMQYPHTDRRKRENPVPLLRPADTSDSTRTMPNASSDFVLGKQAIVIGGGMAGLLAARVLHKYFECVTIIERDHYPATPTFRPGTPQARHLHLLLLEGQRVVEKLFPGIQEKLLAQGAIQGDFIKDYAYYNPSSGWYPRVASSLKGYSCSRFLLEWQVRQEVLACEQVKFLEGQEVVELLANSDASAITGVMCRARGVKQSGEGELTRLDADFVVDTSGRDSHAPQWLQKLGYEPPVETVINPEFGYASRIYEPSATFASTWKGLLVVADPPHYLRGGAIWPHEDGSWMVILTGTGGDYPPTDEENFIEFARSLPGETFFAALKDARPLSSIYGYRHTENRQRHFERLTRLPENFIVLGDANCAFNPVYGQGMTVAALGVALLDSCLRSSLRDGLTGLPQRFQRQVAKLNALPWELAAASDYRSPSIQNHQSNLLERFMHRYFDSIFAVLPSSPATTLRFVAVLHMVKPPSALFHPVIIFNVIKHSLLHARHKSRAKLES